MYGAQAAGCAPIVSVVERGGDTIEPVVPRTIARSIAIGNPADGRFAGTRHPQVAGRGGAASVSDDELVAGIRLLAETTGVFTETAGGVTVAAAQKLAAEGQLRASDEVVLCITGNGLKTIEAIQTALPAARFPELGPRLRDAKGEPCPYVIFYLDDDDIRFQKGFATPLADGAEIVVVPAIAGG